MIADEKMGLDAVGQRRPRAEAPPPICRPVQRAHNAVSAPEFNMSVKAIPHHSTCGCTILSTFADADSDSFRLSWRTRSGDVRTSTALYNTREKRRLGRGMWLTPSSGAEAIQKIKDKQVASMAQPCAAMPDASDPGVCRDCKGQALAQYEAACLRGIRHFNCHLSHSVRLELEVSRRSSSRRLQLQ